MTLPFALPDWLPWWVPIVLLVPAVLYALVFLIMPFSVLGLKGRLDGIETRIDELHAELRALSLRLGEAGRSEDRDDPYGSALSRRPRAHDPTRPPIAPMTPRPSGSAAAPPREAEREERAPAATEPPRRRSPGAARRSEPKLDWPP